MRTIATPFCLLLALASGCGGASQGAAPVTATEEVKDQGGGGGNKAARVNFDGATVKGKIAARKVIKTGRLRILTDDLQDGFTKANEMAKRMKGYTLSSERGDKHVELTLRVPSFRFDEALCRLGRLGKVDEREITGQDVTARHVDLTLRLRNAERMHRRYLELLARATNVAETLEVQREIERVTNTIESLRGQLNLIDNQVALATIHLRLQQPTRPGPLGWVFYGLYKGLVWLFVW